MDAYGIDIFEKTIELYLNKTVTIKPTYFDAVAVSFLFANREGYFKSVQGLDAVKSNQSQNLIYGRQALT